MTFALLSGIVSGLMLTAGHTTSPPPQQNRATTAPTAIVADSFAARVDAFLKAWDRPASPGVAVVIVRDTEIVYNRGFGEANLEAGTSITPETVFNSASLSKQFTAFAITLLADQRRLGFDDDVHRYLPELPDFGATITIRHLLTHTSGLRDQVSLAALAGWRLDDPVTRADMMRLIVRQNGLNFPPGTQWLYNNTGYTLLAEIVARVTGESFSRWMAANVFIPLGMVHTHVVDDYSELVPGRAESYQHGANGFSRRILNSAAPGPTDLLTTSSDLARWAQNLQTGRIGGRAILTAMEQPAVLADGQVTGYGFGVAVGTYHGLPTISHDGAAAGFRTALIRFPSAKLSVVVLSNLESFPASAAARQIADVYLGDQRASQLAPLPAPSGAPNIVNVRVEPSRLDALVGSYEMSPAFVGTIRRDGDHLTAQWTGQPDFPLFARSDSVFFYRAFEADLSFHRGSSGTVDRIILHQGGASHPARRLPLPAPDSLTPYVGDFYSAELDTWYSLRIERGQLIVRHPRQGEAPLIPAGGADAFVGAAWWFERVTFTRAANGAVTGFLVSSNRARNVRFDRRRGS